MRQVWEYKTAAGVLVRGIWLGYSDRGGTDITYRFHRLDQNNKPITHDNGGIELDLVSGSRLLQAKRIGTLPA
jgi:hypothetical protein